MESKPEISEASNEASIVQERLSWKLAWRDDAKVAQGLYAGEEIEEMHELSDAGLLDEFFVFAREFSAQDVIVGKSAGTFDYRVKFVDRPTKQ